MTNPSDRAYTDSHEWLSQINNDDVRIGLTGYAVNQLGDIVFINLPEVGDEVTLGEPLGDVESSKAVSDIFSPVSGTVRAVNEALMDSPEIIKASPYDAWLVEVENVTAAMNTLTPEQYQELCEKGGK